MVDKTIPDVATSSNQPAPVIVGVQLMQKRHIFKLSQSVLNIRKDLGGPVKNVIYPLNLWQVIGNLS